MITVNDFCKKEYGEKLYKISFDAGFTCPNRDGTLGENGCIFCSKGGSGDFAVRLYANNCCESEGAKCPDTEAQIALAKQKISKKYKGTRFIAYFQAFTNTYADVKTLRNIYFPIINRPDIAVLSIATRPDCISEEVLELLRELNAVKPVWVELGLQTIKDSSVKFIRRGYDTEVYDEVVGKLNDAGIHTITHVILYLPGETQEDMLETVRHVVLAGSKGIKLSLLHVLKGTDLAEYFLREPFHIPNLSEYIETLGKCIKIIPDDMVVHRLTGDPPKRLLIEPKWSADKKKVINAINDALFPGMPYYVYMLRCNDGSFYTGSTNDVDKRFAKHASGKGCKYSASHLPVEKVYVEKCNSKHAALSREYAVKQLTHAQKEELIASDKNLLAIQKPVTVTTQI